MKIGLKITVFVLSWFLLYSPSVNASSKIYSPADATRKLNDTMEGLAKLLKDHGYNFSDFKSYLDGQRSPKNTFELEVEADDHLGDRPIVVVERKENGKLIVVASRRGRSEVGTDLTNDNTHQQIVKDIEAQGSNANQPVSFDYKDKTGATFRVSAAPLSYLEKDLGPENRRKGFIYVATEVEVIPEAVSIPVVTGPAPAPTLPQSNEVPVSREEYKRD